MLPHLSSSDATYESLIHAEFLGDDCLPSCVRSDEQDLRGGQFSPGLHLATGVPSFTRAVGHIRCLIPQEQMVDLDTASPVTAVENVAAGRNRALVRNPTGTMRSHYALAHADVAITRGAQSGGEISTAIWAGLTLEKKAFFKRCALGRSESHGDVSASLMIRARSGVASAASPELYRLQGYSSCQI